MYLNKTAELTEQIILVPRIIEMSCRITQRKETRMHSSEHQRCHWHPLLFPFQITELQSCQGAMESWAKVSPWCQRTFCCCFNERRSLQLETSQQTGSDILWLQNNFEVHPEKSCCCFFFFFLNHYYFFFFVVYPCRMLPLVGYVPSVYGGHLLVQRSSGKNKLCCQNDPLGPLKSPGERLLLPWKWGRRSLSHHRAGLGRFSEEFKRTETCKTQKGSNLSDFRQVHLKSDTKKEKHGAWHHFQSTGQSLLFIYILIMTKLG